MMDRITATSPRLTARIAGVFYLGTFVTGVFALKSGGLVTNLVADACYVGVTLLFYILFRPVSARISLLAAFFSLVGCIVGALSAFHVDPTHINSLGFFGFYCVLIGYLIVRSTFLPRILGMLMAFGGLGWLTFLSPSLAHSLAPYNMAPGILAEGLLTLWLLVMGVNAQRWQAQAGVPEHP